MKLRKSFIYITDNFFFKNLGIADALSDGVLIFNGARFSVSGILHHLDLAVIKTGKNHRLAAVADPDGIVRAEYLLFT